MTIRLRLTLATLSVVLVHSALPTGVSAQAPGYRGPDARQLRAQYRAEIIGRMNQLMADWGEAWSEDDMERLSELYVEDAVIIPPGEDPVRGWPAIHTWLVGRLAQDGAVDAFLQDFDAAGGMAMGESNYRIRIQPSAGGGERTGRLVTVLIERGNRWRIRTQVFIPH